MNIAIFGASSQIAKDLLVSFFKKTNYRCCLFVRNKVSMNAWISEFIPKSKYNVFEYSEFYNNPFYDVIFNFVGVGDPAATKKFGSSIADITLLYDSIVIKYLNQNPSCKYIFLSSGAVYGGEFEDPATSESQSMINGNSVRPTDWYAVSKFNAEVRHRALSQYSIVDIRVFNYFSHTQDMSARFLITDIVRAIKCKDIFKTSIDNIVRDYITPDDFFNFIKTIIKSKSVNMAVDCYTKSPVDKWTLLSVLESKYGLKVEISEKRGGVNATGSKINYYSLNKVAESLGFFPKYSSLEGILVEIDQIIKKITWV
jgi:nucleoside-diphosphate-sugar epimerase